MSNSIYWTGTEAVQSITTATMIADINAKAIVTQDDSGVAVIGTVMDLYSMSWNVLSHIGFYGVDSVSLRQWGRNNEVILTDDENLVTVFRFKA